MRSLALVLLVASCSLSSTAVPCEDGMLCADGTHCVAVMVNAGSASHAQDFCVTQKQLDACTAGNDKPCMIDDTTRGTCHGGACFADACGDGLVDVDTDGNGTNELCDDGNLANGDGCRQDCMSNETCGNGTVDHAQGETCDDANLLAHDGCTSTCQQEVPVWEVLRQPASWEPDALAYDAHRGRVVSLGSEPGNLSFGTAETQEWDGRSLHRAQTPIAPPYPVQGALAYDAADKTLVLFGGYSGDDSTWTYGADGWHLVSTPTAPAARGGNAMTYDARRGRVLMFGGENPATAMADTEVWSLKAGQWSMVPTPASPRPAFRSAAGMAYDPTRDVVVLVGGVQSKTGTPFNDVWELAFDPSGAGTWTNKTPGSNPFPTGAFSATFAPPPIGKVLAVTRAGSPFAEVWNGATWSSLPAIPGGVTDARVTTDIDRAVVVLYGAKDDGAGGSIAALSEFDPVANKWSAPYTFGASPAVREDADTATDPRRRQLVRYGGSPIGGGTPYGDTWVWDGTWRVAPSSPPARRSHRMVYDPIRDEIVMFGGIKSAGGVTNETWVWRHSSATDFGHWEQRTPAALPPVRFFHQMAWDGQSGRVLLYGGRGPTGFTLLDDTYAWDGTTWAPLDVPRSASSPPATQLSGMAYDAKHGDVVLFDQISRGTYLWTGSAWTTPATPPTDRPQTDPTAIAWDPTVGQLVLSNLTSIWSWDHVHSNWVRAEVPDAPVGGEQTLPELATDPAGAGFISLGSPADTNFPGELARLRYDAAVREPEETCVTEDIDGNGAAGCADVNCWSVCRPLCVPGDTSAACAAPPSTASPGCGDTVCDPGVESCLSCPGDCGACPAVCGNEHCDAGETTASCPGDCP